MADSPGILVPYSQAAPQIEDADLLLWRNGGLVSLWTHSPYKHAATVYWEPEGMTFPGGFDTRPRIVDTREGAGGRDNLSLAAEVEVAPGRIDVFSVNTERFPEYSREGAVKWARLNIPGRPYGRRTFLNILLTRLPFLRWFYRPDFDDLSTLSGYHVCSTARCAMDRLGGGVDPVKNLADAFVTPGMLANSMLFDYRFTLTPDTGQEE